MADPELAARPVIPVPLISGFLTAASAVMGISPDTIRASGRTRAEVRARWIVMLALRDLRDMSTTQIGRRLGGRDHSTVIHGIRQARDLLGRDPEFAATYAEVTRRVMRRRPAQEPSAFMATHFIRRPIFPGGEAE